jgi:hypothetical protein
MKVAGYVITLLVFFGIYALLYVRAQRQGRSPAIQWGWLAAILLCAGAAIVLGTVL